MSDPQPPRLARAFLRFTLPSNAREAVMGDLEEEFEEQRQRVGRLRSGLWYWTQAMRSIRACRIPPALGRERSRGDFPMMSLLADVRYGLRLLARNPGYATVAIATIALGVGTTVAIGSVAYAVLLRPLPYADESRVVMVWETDPANGFPTKGPTPANFLDWVQRTQSFEHMGALAPYEATLTGAGEPARITGRRISAAAFRALGTAPALGRLFDDADENVGNGLTILSNRVWSTYFSADPSIIGRTILLNDNPRRVAAIMPADFRLPGGDDDVFIPLVFSETERRARGSHFLNTVARLRHDVTLGQAQAEMDTIAAALAVEHPRWNAKEGALLEPIRQAIVGEIRTAILVITAAAALVLLIACVNVTNLQLARGVGRAGELALRRALGAGRARLARQLLTESAVIALAGGLLGVLLAWAGVMVLRNLLPASLAHVSDLQMDRTMLIAAAAVTAASGLIAGLAPAFYSWDASARGAASVAHRTTSGVRAGRLRHGLVVAEVALAVVLLIGAGLLLRSFSRLSAVDPGFTTTGRLTFRVELPRGRYGTPEKWAPFMDSLASRLEALPGVLAAGGTSWLPLTESGGSNALMVEGRPLPAPGEAVFVTYRLVTPGYFRAIGIPLLSGRFFDSTDSAASARVVVVNQTLASRYWSGQDPIGKRVTFSRNPSERDWMTIVGVVGDTRINGLSEPVAIAMYAPHTQDPYWFPPTHMVVHTSGEPAAIAAAAREQVRALDPLLPVSDVRTAEEIVGEHVAEPRFQSLLVTSFGAAALLLAAIGVYGMLSISAAARTREFGVRLALGASPRQIVRIVILTGARVAGAGLVVGLVLGAAASRWLASMLYEIEPSDAVAFGSAAVVLAMLALLASYIPARRAARVEPVSALRSD